MFFSVCMRPAWALFLYYFIYMRQHLIPYHFCMHCTQAYSTCTNIAQTHIEKNFLSFFRARKRKKSKRRAQHSAAAVLCCVVSERECVCTMRAIGMRKWSLWSWWAIDSRYSLHSTSVSWNTLNEVDSFLFNCVFVCLFVCWFGFGWFSIQLWMCNWLVSCSQTSVFELSEKQKQTNSNDRQSRAEPRVSVLTVVSECPSVNHKWNSVSCIYLLFIFLSDVVFISTLSLPIFCARACVCLFVIYFFLFGISCA